jgi:hypothetical protein
MDRIITANVWTRVTKIIKSDYKTAAIAYVSKGTPLIFKEGDTLVCDASDQAVKSGETDAKTIKRFFKDGARLFSCSNLHAKLLICNDLAIIGSANLSHSAENHLIEAVLVSTRSTIRSQVNALIHNIITGSTPIDRIFILHICSLPVDKRFRSFGPRKKKIIEEMGNRYWIINSHPLNRVRKEEEELIEQGEEEARELAEDSGNDIEWIRFTGKSRFRDLAKPGDTIIRIFKSNNRSTVSQPLPILVRQDHKKWTRIYIEEPSLEISWTAFEKKIRKVGLKKIKKGSFRELSTKEIALMESIWQA